MTKEVELPPGLAGPLDAVMDDDRAPRQAFPAELYRQRWQAESAFSRHKRRLGAALTARGPGAQDRELVLRVLTHNLALLAGAG